MFHPLPIGNHLRGVPRFAQLLLAEGALRKNDSVQEEDYIGWGSFRQITRRPFTGLPPEFG